jgi:hypothetical protein
MKKLSAIVLGIVLVASFTSGALAKEAAGDSKAGKPGAIAVEVVNWSATVKAIDYVKKTAVLVDENGREVSIDVKKARNLDQVLVGDKVKVKYVEELVIFVRKSDAPPRAGVTRTVALAPKGKMPGGIIADTAQIQANVEDIDYNKRTITLKGPAGNIRTYKVSKEVKRLKDVKKGDQVVLDVTQALALEVVKP